MGQALKLRVHRASVLLTTFTSKVPIVGPRLRELPLRLLVCQSRPCTHVLFNMSGFVGVSSCALTFPKLSLHVDRLIGLEKVTLWSWSVRVTQLCDVT